MSRNLQRFIAAIPPAACVACYQVTAWTDNTQAC